MKRYVIAKSNTDSKLYELAKAYVEDPCSPTYNELKKMIFDMEGIKSPSKPVYLSKNINASTSVIFDLSDALNDIAEKYVTSDPVSGDWDTETDSEVEEIASAFNISEDSAKCLMINKLGFDEDMF